MRQRVTAMLHAAAVGDEAGVALLASGVPSCQDRDLLLRSLVTAAIVGRAPLGPAAPGSVTDAWVRSLFAACSAGTREGLLAARVAAVAGGDPYVRAAVEMARLAVEGLRRVGDPHFVIGQVASSLVPEDVEIPYRATRDRFDALQDQSRQRALVAIFCEVLASVGSPAPEASHGAGSVARSRLHPGVGLLVWGEALTSRHAAEAVDAIALVLAGVAKVAGVPAPVGDLPEDGLAAHIVEAVAREEFLRAWMLRDLALTPFTPDGARTVIDALARYAVSVVSHGSDATGVPVLDVLLAAVPRARREFAGPDAPRARFATMVAANLQGDPHLVQREVQSVVADGPGLGLLLTAGCRLCLDAVDAVGLDRQSVFALLRDKDTMLRRAGELLDAVAAGQSVAAHPDEVGTPVGLGVVLALVAVTAQVLSSGDARDPEGLLERVFS